MQGTPAYAGLHIPSEAEEEPASEGGEPPTQSWWMTTAAPPTSLAATDSNVLAGCSGQSSCAVWATQTRPSCRSGDHKPVQQRSHQLHLTPSHRRLWQRLHPPATASREPVLAWHPAKPLLAACSGSHRVFVFQIGAPLPSGTPVSALETHTAPACTLAHAQQSQVGNWARPEQPPCCRQGPS